MKKGTVTDYEVKKTRGFFFDSNEEVEYQRDTMLMEKEDIVDDYASLNKMLSKYRGHNLEAGEENFGITEEDLEDGLELNDYKIMVADHLSEMVESIHDSLNSELSEQGVNASINYQTDEEDEDESPYSSIATIKHAEEALDSIVGTYRKLVGKAPLGEQLSKDAHPYEDDNLTRALVVAGKGKNREKAAKIAKEQMYGTRCFSEYNDESLCDLRTPGFEAETVSYTKDDKLTDKVKEIKKRKDICAFAKDNLIYGIQKFDELREQGAFAEDSEAEFYISNKEIDKMGKILITDGKNKLVQDTGCGIEAIIDDEGDEVKMQIAFGVIALDYREGKTPTTQTGSLVSPERAMKKSTVRLNGESVRFNYRNVTDKIGEFELEGDYNKNKTLLDKVFKEKVDENRTKVAPIKTTIGTEDVYMNLGNQEDTTGTKGLSNNLDQYDEFMIGADEEQEAIVEDLLNDSQPEQEPIVCDVCGGPKATVDAKCEHCGQKD